MLFHHRNGQTNGQNIPHDTQQLVTPQKNTKLAENKKTVENHIPNTSRHNNMIITVITFLTNLLKIAYTIILSIIRQIKYLIRISVTNSNHLKMIDGPTGLVNYFKHYTTNFGRTKVWPKWIFVNGNHVTEIRSMFDFNRRLTIEAKKFWHRKMENYVSIDKFSIHKKKIVFGCACLVSHTYLVQCGHDNSSRSRLKSESSRRERICCFF